MIIKLGSVAMLAVAFIGCVNEPSEDAASAESAATVRESCAHFNKLQAKLEQTFNAVARDVDVVADLGGEPIVVAELVALAASPNRLYRGVGRTAPGGDVSHDFVIREADGTARVYRRLDGPTGARAFKAGTLPSGPDSNLMIYRDVSAAYHEADHGCSG